MSKYTFSTQTGKAYYCNSIPGFIADTSHNIVGQLVHHLVGAGFTAGFHDVSAFENQIEELQKRLEACQMEGDIIFEYDIVRLGKRIDVSGMYAACIPGTLCRMLSPDIVPPAEFVNVASQWQTP